MADPTPIPKPHLQIQPKPVRKGNSCSDFVIKFLFLAIFVVVLLFFPSQAPEFLNQTILTKLWELLHLLFIGIVVAYGLFSRRNAELETNLETQPSGDSSNSNNSTTPSYVSKFFPASTIFGDESEIENGFEENKMMMHWNDSQYFEGNSNSNSTVGVFDEQYNTQKLGNSDDNFGYSGNSVRFDDGNGTNVVQSWSSEYYYSEPVVVAQPYYGNGECGEVVGHKPLGLPVRSLKLVESEVDGLRYVDENASDLSLGSIRSAKRLDMSEDREFGDMDPTNLEKEFNDAAVGGVGGGIASHIDWNSRFGRMEREKVYGNVNGSSQFSSISVDDTKFDGLGSNTASFFSHAGVYSSFDSIASDNVNFQEEEMTRKESSFEHASEMKNFQDNDVRRRKVSFVPAQENMIFEEDEMIRKESSFVHASEMKNFQDKDVRRRKTSFVPAPENMVFEEEDKEQRIQRRDLGKKVSEGRSLRNRRMATKGKHADGVYPANFRTMSADETQFESHGSSFQSARSFSSDTGISSATIDFQEEDGMVQKESFPLHTSENMNSRDKDMEQKNTSYAHASENVDFHVEDLGQKKNSFVPVSEDMDFEEMDLVKMISQVSSRNETMETRGRYAVVPHPSNFRPISVDEIQLESRSSRSLQSMGSFSSHTSNTSMRSSLDSVSSENMNSLQEGLGEKKSLHGSSSSSSSSSSSPSSSARRNVETSLQPFEDRGYSINSLLHDDLKGKSGIVDDDPPPRYEESVMHRLHLDSDKPTSLAKALAKGKSVRTRRVNGLTSGTKKNDEISSKQADDDKVVLKKPKSREPDSILKGISKKTLDCYIPNHNEGTFSSHRKRDKPEPLKNVYKEDSDKSIQGSSDDDRVSEYVNESGLDSEVDKKASEFIAKFKAQIRLQKTVSIERSKGQKMFGDNNVR
ncbi:uncharacterized protein LOC131608769 [Vicia villosa]|uniref:uncharacterized protein LOC131608769 n=1 Tax=Vicia villosa TaxID=3911 RepID=UPI00273AB37C|nr:uncharacterized protein LOC131608769 [Vicia villosa]